MLDHAGEDSFALDGDLIGIDMTELMDLERERMAILSYLFRRIECLVEDGRPTLIVLDEAWKLLDDGYFAKRLKDWMLTMRKKNTALVMLVQQVSHLQDSRAGRAIIENAVTRLILPNPEARAEDYALLGLNDAECAVASAASFALTMAASDTQSLAKLAAFVAIASGGLASVIGGYTADPIR